MPSDWTLIDLILALIAGSWSSCPWNVWREEVQTRCKATTSRASPATAHSALLPKRFALLEGKREWAQPCREMIWRLVFSASISAAPSVNARKNLPEEEQTASWIQNLALLDNLTHAKAASLKMKTKNRLPMASRIRDVRLTQCVAPDSKRHAHGPNDRGDWGSTWRTFAYSLWSCQTVNTVTHVWSGWWQAHCCHYCWQVRVTCVCVCVCVCADCGNHGRQVLGHRGARSWRLVVLRQTSAWATISRAKSTPIVLMTSIAILLQKSALFWLEVAYIPPICIMIRLPFAALCFCSIGSGVVGMPPT